MLERLTADMGRQKNPLGFEYGQADGISRDRSEAHPDGSFCNTGSILSVRVSGTIPSFLGTLVLGLPGSFPVSAEATFRQEGE
jgi:hypothetical protein